MRMGRLLMAGALVFSSAEPVRAATVPTIVLPKKTVRVTTQVENWVACGDQTDVTTGLRSLFSQFFGQAPGSPALRLDLKHNSGSGADSVWGFGWGTELDQALLVQPNLNLVWRDSNHIKRTFFNVTQSSQAPVQYTPPTNTFANLTVMNFSAQGTPMEASLRQKDGTELEFQVFAATGTLLLVSLVDRNGNAIAFIRDGQGRLMRVQDVHGRFIDFTYHSSGRVATAVDSGGRAMSFSFDGFGEKISETGPEGTTAYEYDAAHRITKVTYPNGGARTISYDAQGRVLLEEDDGGANRRKYEYFASSTVVTDALSRETVFHYINRGGLRRVSKIIDATGRETAFTYDTQMNLIAQTDPSGQDSELVYDGNGNITQSISPGAASTQVSYEPQFNRPTSIINPNGHSVTLGYDSEGNLTSINDAGGNPTTMAYDAQGHVTSAQDPLSHGTSFGYDPITGAMNSVTDPLSRSSTFERDGLSRLTRYEDPLGRETLYEYDVAGNLTKVTDASGGVTEYTYVAGRGRGKLLQSLTDSANHTTTFSYDNLGYPTSVTNAVGEARSYSYDSEGNLISFTNGNQQTISYSYDGFNRLVTKATPDGTVGYQYDANDAILRVENYNGAAMQFVRDPAGRVLQAIQTFPSGNSGTISYQYDAAGNKTSLSTPWGTFSYQYDSRGLLTSIASPGVGQFQINHDAASRRTKLTYPSGIESNYFFDAASQLTRIEHRRTIGGSLISFVDYAYDANGNRTTATDTLGTHAYSYDQLQRLIGADHPAGTALPNGTEVFQYDGVGNRLSDANIASYVYDDANRLLSNSSFTYIHDADGRLVEVDGVGFSFSRDFEYDTEGRLTRIQEGTKSTRFEYDAFGRVVEIHPSSGVIRQRLYDGPNLLAELNTEGELLALYTHGPRIDEPLAAWDGSNYVTAHADGLGSIAALASSTGAVVARYEYAAYGTSARSVLIPSPTAIVADFPFSFTGREETGFDGLLQYRKRYLDTTIGRFLTEDDPALLTRDPNKYRYVENRPTRSIDPLGSAYTDVNVSLLGVTGGVLISNDKYYFYGGGGLVTPGITLTFSPDNPQPGLNKQFGVSPQPTVLSPAVVNTLNPENQWGWEAGIGTPGVNISLLKIFNPITTDDITKSIRRVVDYLRDGVDRLNEPFRQKLFDEKSTSERGC